MSTFSGKKVYITGGSSGIGLAISVRMAQLGANVVVFGRSQKRLDQAKTEIEVACRSPEQRVHAFAVDVGDDGAVAETMAEAVAAAGPPDVVIPSAGISVTKAFRDMEPAEFATVIRTNLLGTSATLAALLPAMAGRGRSILLVSSMAGITGAYGYSAYCASKFALMGLAEVLRWELADAGVSVSVLCPPEVDTPFVEEEKATIPAEARAAKDLLGTLSPEYVADQALRGLARKQFLIVPGFRAKLLVFLGQVLPRSLMYRTTVWVTSSLVRNRSRR